MSSTTELARHEARAQHGIIEFAEEMQTIRDEGLYPGAEQDSGNVKAAWKTYCDQRWGMSARVVQETIQALPVLKRLERSAGTLQLPSVTAASRVASLPEKVQDAILSESPKRNDASDKAKAARKAKERIETTEGREATDEELIAAAAAVKAAPKPKKKPKMKASKFVSNLAQSHWHLEQAANIAHSEPIDDVENDYGFAMIAKFNYEIERLREKLYQPEIVKDADEAFAELLGGEEK